MPGGAWMIDLGANFMVRVIVLLVIAALQSPALPRPEPQVTGRPPLGRGDVVAMLHARLFDAETPSAEFTRTGIRGTPEGARLVFVFDTARLPGATLRGDSLILPVPEALRRADGQNWSAEFLALQDRRLDEAAFVAALADQRAGEGAGTAAPDRAGGGGGIVSFFERWLLAVNAACAGMAALGLVWLARRVRRITGADAAVRDRSGFP